jgi:hypothetical protein
MSQNINENASKSVRIMPVISNQIQMESSNHKSTNKHRIIQTIVDFIVIVIIFLIVGLVYLFQDPKINYFTCDQSDIFFQKIPGFNI